MSVYRKACPEIDSGQPFLFECEYWRVLPDYTADVETGTLQEWVDTRHPVQLRQECHVKVPHGLTVSAGVSECGVGFDEIGFVAAIAAIAAAVLIYAVLCCRGRRARSREQQTWGFRGLT
jgi:hypothetical protein